MRHKIILDVDTGHDDMIAIVMASGLPQIEVMGIVAVAGNQVLEKTLLNTLHVCDLIGQDAPVFAGSDRPLIRPKVVAGDIHGKSGLDGPTFPPLKKQAEKMHGVNFIIETILANPHEITLVPTGPLTDIAMAIRLEPKIVNLVKKIVLMGGSMQRGNRTEHAEFNIFADAEAAHIVFSSGAPLVMMGLDVTLQVQLNEERLERYKQLNTRTTEMFAASMSNYMEACRRHGADYPAMHDPICVAYVADNSLFTLKPYNIKVELKDEVKYGRTWAKEGSSVLVGTGVDEPKFWKLLEQSFANLP